MRNCRGRVAAREVRRDPRPGRRERQREDRDVPRGARASGSRLANGGRNPSRANTDHRRSKCRPACLCARSGSGDDLPGCQRLAQSDRKDRQAAHEDGRAAARRIHRRGSGDRAGSSKARRNAGSGRTPSLLPVPVVGRPEPEGDDRRGTGGASRTALCRRTDNGARRHGAVPDPRPDQVAAGRNENGSRVRNP